MEIRKHLPLFGLGALLVVLVGAAIIIQRDGENTDFRLALDPEKECNVLGATLYGVLTTYILSSADVDSEDRSEEVTQTSSDHIRDAIERGENDSSIKAIVLEIDSPGGYAIAGEEVANALKRAQKPTIALLRNSGTSAAYWAATGADVIYASENSDVGGIGVTLSYLDNVEKNKKEGLTYHEISSAKFKDYGNPDKPLTEEEHKLFLRDIQIIHDNFVHAIAKNRNLGISEVEALADGSSMLGQMALDNGLIDEIGGISEVVEYLEETLGEEINICW